MTDETTSDRLQRSLGHTPGSPAAPFEHDESYLLGVLRFIGLTNVTIVRAEGLVFGPEARENITVLVA